MDLVWTCNSIYMKTVNGKMQIGRVRVSVNGTYVGVRARRYTYWRKCSKSGHLCSATSKKAVITFFSLSYRGFSVLSVIALLEMRVASLVNRYLMPEAHAHLTTSDPTLLVMFEGK